MTGLWIALGVIALAVVVGLVWRARQGQLRAPGAAPVPAAVRETAVEGSVTLLMLTSPVCARCPQARAVLAEVAAAAAGVRIAELDLAAHPDVADGLGVRSTPTTLALSGSGDELFRIVGVPRRADLIEALRPHV